MASRSILQMRTVREVPALAAPYPLPHVGCTWPAHLQNAWRVLAGTVSMVSGPISIFPGKRRRNMPDNLVSGSAPQGSLNACAFVAQSGKWFTIKYFAKALVSELGVGDGNLAAQIERVGCTDFSSRASTAVSTRLTKKDATETGKGFVPPGDAVRRPSPAIYAVPPLRNASAKTSG